MPKLPPLYYALLFLLNFFSRRVIIVSLIQALIAAGADVNAEDHRGHKVRGQTRGIEQCFQGEKILTGSYTVASVNWV